MSLNLCFVYIYRLDVLEKDASYFLVSCHSFAVSGELNNGRESTSVSSAADADRH